MLIRSRLLSCALALLVCQLGVAAVAPVAMCRAGAPLEAGSADVMCTSCAHSGGSECPMHKAQAPGGTSETSRWCAGCGEQMAVILSALAGSVGILRHSEQAFGPFTSGVVLTALVASTLDAAHPPTSPPPRS
jgi:hypothetical protein